jgi:predicted phosphoadenosine phosphosulfate sulfurtransferase
MRVYKTTNVWEESLNRIRYLFDEFDEVYVSVSGGKDSTIVYNLAKIVAREKNRLPLKVVFLDQEAEFQATIDYVKSIMYDPEVDPYWLQIPIKLFNATSKNDEWLECWKEGADWMREKDPIAYKENIWGTDRFHKFFRHFLDVESKGRKICDITGVRGEESPGRLLGLTNAVTYKWITWGKRNAKNTDTFTFHPIYDWSYTDVWKAIHDNGWEYNKIYDYQYMYGTPIHHMRISNLHHETSIHHIFMLQEVEPDTYQKLTERVQGVDAAGKLGKEDYYIKSLPYMFSSWKEYRDYLLERLIDEDKQVIFKKQFQQSEKFSIVIPPEQMYRKHINCILANDYHGTKLKNAHNDWNLKLKDYTRELKRNEMARRKAAAEQRQK